MTAKKSPAQKAAAAKKAEAAKQASTAEQNKQQGTTAETHQHLAASSVRRRHAGLDESPAKESKSDPMVTVRIPRAFKLQVLDDKQSRLVQYESGIGEMPRSHAEMQYAKDNGVEIVAE